MPHWIVPALIYTFLFMVWKSRLVYLFITWQREPGSQENRWNALFFHCIVLIIHTSTTCSKNCRVPISLGNIGSSSKWYFYSSCSNMTFAIVITDLEVGIMFSLKKNGIQHKKRNLGKLQTMHKQLILNSFEYRPILLQQSPAFVTF